jgi:NAD+ kinase
VSSRSKKTNSIIASSLFQDHVLIAEQRTNLSIEIHCDSPQFHKDPYETELAAEKAPVLHFFALNELNIARGSRGRSIDYTYYIDGVRLAELRGDGIVVSTATGSTAYALSAGGPVVAPGYSGLVVVPVAPHTLHSRAIVTSPSDVVEIDLKDSDDNRESVVFIDGELVELPTPIRKVIVRPGDEPTILLRYKRGNFYSRTSEVFFG